MSLFMPRSANVHAPHDPELNHCCGGFPEVMWRTKHWTIPTPPTALSSSSEESCQHAVPLRERSSAFPRHAKGTPRCGVGRHVSCIEQERGTTCPALKSDLVVLPTRSRSSPSGASVTGANEVSCMHRFPRRLEALDTFWIYLDAGLRPGVPENRVSGSRCQTSLTI